MNTPIKIFITSWNRPDLLRQVITKIHQRTKPGSFQIIVYDNASDQETVNYLQSCLENKQVYDVFFDSVNSGCLKPKIVFHEKSDSETPFYVVTDNDIIPPDLTPDWLEQMVSIMEANPDVALLTPQLPPTWLQEPYEKRGSIILCSAVGNTFKMLRRSSIPIEELKKTKDRFGDDGILCKMLCAKGWKVAFASDIFCYNLERDENMWGYTLEQINQDPRKSGYGPPFSYIVKDWKTLEPPDTLKI